jgi:carbamoyltransferase
MSEKYILGFSGGPRGSHEASVSLLSKQSGMVIAVFQEERFNRFKSSVSCFPTQAILRLLSTYGDSLRGLIDNSYSPGYSYHDMKERIPSYLSHNFGISARHTQFHHQVCHAANAFYSSDFENAAVVCLDGVGDRCSGFVGVGNRYRIQPIRFMPKEESVGIFWSLICQYLGYDGLDDAYKVMGLAPYGVPKYSLESLFNYAGDLRFSFDNNYVLDKYSRVSLHPSENICAFPLFDFGETFSRRLSFQPIEQIHMDIAASAQLHLEASLVKFFTDIRRITGQRYLCLGGGVMMNSHFLGHLASLSIFDKIYVSPTPGDCGLSMGAAQFAFAYSNRQRPLPLSSPFLGTSYTLDQVKKELAICSIPYTSSDYYELAEDLVAGKVIGFFTGRAEIGPRALGARSILALPNIQMVKDLVNSKIKFRESYRPFAPVVLEDEFQKYFMGGSINYDYMSATTTTTALAPLHIPAVVHIDGTSRVQIADRLSPLGQVLQILKQSGYPGVLLNTSFNLKGEPNVETPKDALRTFFSSGLDCLYIEGLRICKAGNAE